MSTKLCVIPLALILAVGITACGTSTDAPPPPTSGDLTGVVMDTAMNPLGGATVMVMRGGDMFQTTAAGNGNYEFLDLAAGTWAMTTYMGTVEFIDDNRNVFVSGATDEDIELEAAPAYVGADRCIACHAGAHSDVFQTGHPYKLNKVENDQQPTYPFSDIDDALALLDDDDENIPGGLADPRLGVDNMGSGNGTPQNYTDITYVIGGYFWKARFIGTDGYIVTGTSVQYNLDDGSIVAYHNNEDKVYNCGNCHTTGWRHFDAADNPNRQDNLAGMDGTFYVGGVSCEACHGAGSDHVASPSKTNITRFAEPRTAEDFAHGRMGYALPVSCGECHTRDGEADYPTFVSPFNQARIAAGLDTVPVGGRIAGSGGLIKHHEQYDEVFGVDPDTLLTTRSQDFLDAHGDCLTCHNTHGSALYQNDPDYTGPEAVRRDNGWCMTCHPTNDPNLRTGGMKTLECMDCHMPLMSKSALNKELDNGVVVGDVTSHIFTIDASKAGDEQFTADGKFAYPYLTVDHGCRTCHGNDGLFDVSASDTYVFHNNK